MAFFNASPTPTEGKSFFGSYNIPVQAPQVTIPTTLPQKIGGVLKPIAKDIYQTAATIPVRTAQAEELLRTSFFGGPDSKKKAQEFATQPVNIGFGTQVKPLDTSSGARATQQTIGDIIKTTSLVPVGTGLTLAKEAALMGGAYGLGNAMSEGKSFGDTVKDTAIGTVGGLVLGKGLSVLGDARTASKLSKRTDAQITEEALARANFGPIPEASNPRLSLPAPRTAAETPIQLPEKGILESQQKLREQYAPTAEKKPTSPLHEEASKFNVRDDFVNSQIKKETIIEDTRPKTGGITTKTQQAYRSTKKSLTDFIKNETDFLITTQQKIPKGYTEKLTKIWKDNNKPVKVIEPPKSRSTELAKIWNESKGIIDVQKPTNIPKQESIPKTTSLPFGRVTTPENSNKIIGYETNSYGKKTPIYEQTTSVTPQESVAIAKAKKDVAQNTGKIQETVPVKNPEVVPSVPKPVSYTKDQVQSLTKVMETELPPNADPTFVSTTLADQTTKYDAAASVIPTDDLIDMAMGLKPSPAGLNPVSIHTLTSIRKDLTVEQAMRLKNIYPLSQAGQDLSLARLKSGAVIDNPVDMMQAVEKELKEQVIKKGVSKNDIKNLFPDCGFN